MGVFGTLFQTAIDVVKLPISVVKDIATMGGELSESGKSATIKNLEEIKKDLDNLTDKQE